MGADDFNRWGFTGPRFSGKPSDGAAGPDEVRWGDKLIIDVSVPAAGGIIRPAIGGFKQIVQVRRPARVWSVLMNLEWNNPNSGIPLQAAENITAFFSIDVGVGSAAVRLSQDIVLPGPLTPVFTDFGVGASSILANIPAEQLLVSCTAVITAVPFALPRTFNLTLAAMAAPIER